MVRDVYLQPGAPDPVLDNATVLQLVRRHVPGAAAVTGVDESGGEARVYMVDDGIVLKTQRPHRLRPRTSLEKEAFFLDQIARHSHISAPRVFGYGQQDGVEYICMTRMPGASMRRLTPQGQDRMSILHEAGRTLRRLHDLPQEELLASGLLPGDRSADDVATRMRSMLDQALSALSSQRDVWKLDVDAEHLAVRLLERLPRSDFRTALHSNPGPEHVFADPAMLRFTGLIDFGDAYVSHPAFDLRTWPGFEDRKSLLEGYAAEGALGEDFLQTLQVVLAVANMIAIALRPERRERSHENLRLLLKDL